MTREPGVRGQEHLVDRLVPDTKQRWPVGSSGVVGLLVLRAARMLTTSVILVLMLFEPVFRMVFFALSGLGILSAVVIGVSGSAPRFPVIPALLVFAGCGFLPTLYRSLLRGISSEG